MRLRPGDLVTTPSGKAGRITDLSWRGAIRTARVVLACHISIENFQTRGPARVGVTYRRKDLHHAEPK